MSTNAEIETPKKVVRQYTEEFLRSYKDREYTPSEDVKKSEMYIYAPKPPVNRPRVDRSRSRGARVGEAGTRSYLSSLERQELQRRRKDAQRNKQTETTVGKENLQPQIANQIASPAKPTAKAVGKTKKTLPSTPPKAAEESGAEKTDGELTTDDDMTDSEFKGDTTAALLQDAQEQQLLLSVPDTDGSGTANKPESRSLISRGKKPPPLETDERRLSQRRKQVEFGKVTDGYKNYIALRPREKRTKHEPQTPNALQKCSKRSWDGQIRKWRQQLHKYDDVEISPAAKVSTPVKEAPAAPVVDKTPTRPTVTPSKATPTISKEERDELARKRKELEDAKQNTPKKAANVEDGVGA